MRFVLERISQPEIEPVTLAQMKSHLRVAADDVGSPEVPGHDDDNITALIQVAREWAEDFTNRALIDQKWRLSIGDAANWDVVQGPGISHGYFPSNWRWHHWHTHGIRLHRSPAIEVGRITMVDGAGVETELQDVGSPSVPLYELRDAGSKWPRVVGLTGATWTTGLMRIEFRAGYVDMSPSPQPDATLVPARFKQAIKLYAEALYDRDERMMEKLIAAAENLIRPERVDVGFA